MIHLAHEKTYARYYKCNEYILNVSPQEHTLSQQTSWSASRNCYDTSTCATWPTEARQLRP